MTCITMTRILRSLAAMAVLSLSFIPRPLPAQSVPAQAQTKPRNYQFRSVDYPGSSLSTVIAFNGKTAIGGGDTATFSFDGTTYKTLAIPGCPVSLVTGINSRGVMVGSCYPGSGLELGFTYDGKTTVTFGFPGESVWPSAINDAGQIVGYYDDANSSTAFLYQNGAFTTLAYPGALATQPTGINSAGDIVGGWVDSAKIARAFLLKDGIYANVNYPFAAQTFLYGINDSDDMVGWAFDVPDFGTFSFVCVGGAFYQEDITAGSLYLYAIANNGDVAGAVYDLLGNAHGVIGQ
jgi:probable HAF family extracellular repeat protein